jgi:hypothetical protein
MDARIKAGLIAAAGILATLGISPKKVASKVVKGVLDDITAPQADPKRQDELVYVTLSNGEFEAGYESIEEFFNRQVDGGKVCAIKCFHISDFSILDAAADVINQIIDLNRDSSIDISSLNQKWDNRLSFNSDNLVPIMINETRLKKLMIGKDPRTPLLDEEAEALRNYHTRLANSGFSEDFDKVCHGDYLVVVGADDSNTGDLISSALASSIDKIIKMSYLCTYLSKINSDNLLSGTSLVKYLNHVDERSFMLKLISTFVSDEGLDYYANSSPFIYELVNMSSEIDEKWDPSKFESILDDLIASKGLEMVRFHLDVIALVLYSISNTSVGFTGRVWLYDIPDVKYSSYLTDILELSRVNRKLFSSIQNGLFYAMESQFSREVEEKLFDVRYPSGNKYLASISFKKWLIGQNSDLNFDDRWFRYHVRIRRKDDFVAVIPMSGCDLMTMLEDPETSQNGSMIQWTDEARMDLASEVTFDGTFREDDSRNVKSYQRDKVKFKSSYSDVFNVSYQTSLPSELSVPKDYQAGPTFSKSRNQMRLEPHFGKRFGHKVENINYPKSVMKLARHCQVSFIADYSNFAVVPKLNLNLVFYSGKGRGFMYGKLPKDGQRVFAMMDAHAGFSLPTYHAAVEGVSFSGRFYDGAGRANGLMVSSNNPIAGTSCQSFGLAESQIAAIRSTGSTRGRISNSELFNNIGSRMDFSNPSSPRIVYEPSNSPRVGRLLRRSPSYVKEAITPNKSSGVWSTESAGLRPGYLPDNLHAPYPNNDSGLSQYDWPQCYQDVMSEIVTPSKLPFRVFIKFRSALGEDKNSFLVVPNEVQQVLNSKITYYSSDPIVNDDTWRVYFPLAHSLRYGVDIYISNKFDAKGNFAPSGEFWCIGSASMMLPFDLYGDDAKVLTFLDRNSANPYAFDTYDASQGVTRWDIAMIKKNRAPLPETMPKWQSPAQEVNSRRGWFKDIYSQYKDDSPLNYLVSNPLKVDYTILML